MARGRIHVALIVIMAAAIAACGAPSLTSSPTQAPDRTPTQAAVVSPSPSATIGPSQGETPSASAAVTPSPTAAVTPGATPSPVPSPPPTATTGPTATPAPTPEPTLTPYPTAGPVVIGPASLSAPDSVPADTIFTVDWIGPNNQGDYITIIKAGKRKWSGEPYFYTYAGTPRQLQSPTTPGAYELRYIAGGTAKVKARRPITVTDFIGSLSGPASVGAGTEFTVEWTGPASPGDYVTIEPVGATQWVAESYFYTYRNLHTGNLTAPLTDGPHELWYVAGDKTVMLREPITVTPVQASVSGPASANHGATFTVSWTGPHAAGDYIAIAAVGAPEGTYLSYAYVAYANPVTMTAPAAAGQYEIRYVYGGNRHTLATALIQIN